MKLSLKASQLRPDDVIKGEDFGIIDWVHADNRNTGRDQYVMVRFIGAEFPRLFFADAVFDNVQRDAPEPYASDTNAYHELRGNLVYGIIGPVESRASEAADWDQADELIRKYAEAVLREAQQ